MAAIKQLEDKQGNVLFPLTHTSAVVNDNGVTAESRIAALESGKQDSSSIATINGSDITHGGNVSIVAAEGQTITIDAAPTAGSGNAVSSGGIVKFVQVGSEQAYSLINNEYVEKSGVFTTYNGWSRTPFLYVKGLGTLEYTTSRNSEYNVFYDENFQKISYFIAYPGTNSVNVREEAVWVVMSNTTAAMESLVLNLPRLKGIAEVYDSLKDYAPISAVDDIIECACAELSEDDFDVQIPYEILQDGSVYRGSSGQQLFSYNLSPNDKIMGLHVKAQAYPNYPVVAFYNGDTYLQTSSVICGNTNIDMDVPVPSEATKICVVNYPNRYATPSIALKIGVSSVITEIDERLTSVENLGSNSTSILGLNPKCDYEDKIIQLTGKYGNGRDSTVPDPVVFAWFSDIHRDTENLSRIKEFTDEYVTYLTNIISTGDNQNYSQDFSWWAEGGANNFLNVLGNHDAWATLSEVPESDTEGPYQGSSIYLIKPKLCYDKYFAPFISNWGVVQPSDAATLGKCYYYKDFTYNSSTTLRLIVLDCMHYNIYSDLDNGSSIQMAWFESVLADARTNGIPVMVAAHYKATNVTKIDCAFNSEDYISEDSMPLAKEKVDAFISAGGEFVCWIHGHDHFDMTGVVSPNNFLSLGIDTARCPDVWADEKRVVGTKTQDAFNFIAIDTYEKLVKIVRIGSSYRRNLRHKGVLVYRYAPYNGNQVGIVFSE